MNTSKRSPSDLWAELAACAHEVKATSAPADAAALFVKWARKPVEYFLVATLDGAHQLIKIHEITKGLLNRTLIHPREVFREAILDRASAIIVCHNHPSGRLEKSEEDAEITRRLKSAGEVLGIPVLDHLIISKKGFFSFAEPTSLLLPR